MAKTRRKKTGTWKTSSLKPVSRQFSRPWRLLKILRKWIGTPAMLQSRNAVTREALCIGVGNVGPVCARDPRDTPPGSLTRPSWPVPTTDYRQRRAKKQLHQGTGRALRFKWIRTVCTDLGKQAHRTTRVYICTREGTADPLLGVHATTH